MSNGVRDFLENLPIPMVLVDTGRAVRTANRAARELLDLAPAGRDLALYIRHPEVLGAVDRVLKGAREASGDITIPAPVPRDMAFHVSRLESGDPSGVEGAVLVFTDTTEAKRGERMRADFVANVSHELRSPLTALSGFIETLRGPASTDDAARARFLEIMEREARRMTRLVDDLLTLSRVEINEHVRPRGEVDVARQLSNVVEIVAPRARDKGMTIELRIPEDLPPAAGDSDQVNQVFRNLIENAVKYGREDTPVTVTVEVMERIPERTTPGLAVSVRDQGAGIPKEMLPRLTERFFRVDKARSNTEGEALPSTGLGLAIVKHIVNRHRGRLVVDSTLGEGSTFTVYLPR